MRQATHSHDLLPYCRHHFGVKARFSCVLTRAVWCACEHCSYELLPFTHSPPVSAGVRSLTALPEVMPKRSTYGTAARVPSLFCGGSRNLSSPLFTFGN